MLVAGQAGHTLSINPISSISVNIARFTASNSVKVNCKLLVQFKDDDEIME